MNGLAAMARSGLEAAGLRISVSARAVANVLTPGFAPSEVAAEALPEGGVRASVVPGPDPGAARADRALLAGSGADLAKELLAQARGAHLYRANLAVLRTADALDEAALELKR